MASHSEDATLAISVRNLGSIRLAKYCPRCLKVLTKVRFQPPFKFGGALFGDAERAQQAVIGYLLEKDGHLPKPFSPFCDCKARIDFPKHWTKFRCVHDSGVVLYGIPDEIFELEDESLCVIDLKTSHCKGEDDPFHPQYATQVTGYAYIAEALGLGKVTRAGLMYWDVQVDSVKSNPADHYERGTLWLPMNVKPLEVKLDYAIFEPLIKELTDVVNSKDVPEGRAGCDDCRKLDLLYALEKEAELQDRILLRENEDRPHIRKAIKNRIWDRDKYLRDLLQSYRERGELIFSNDGMVAAWEFVCGDSLLSID
jgi:hypothetical protein